MDRNEKGKNGENEGKVFARICLKRPIGAYYMNGRRTNLPCLCKFYICANAVRKKIEKQCCGDVEILG